MDNAKLEEPEKACQKEKDHKVRARAGAGRGLGRRAATAVWHVCAECYAAGWCYRCGQHEMTSEGEWCKVCKRQVHGRV